MGSNLLLEVTIDGEDPAISIRLLDDCITEGALDAWAARATGPGGQPRLEVSVLTVWPDPVPGSPWHLVREYAQYIGVIPLEQDWRARFFTLAVDALPPPGGAVCEFPSIASEGAPLLHS